MTKPPLVLFTEEDGARKNSLLVSYLDTFRRYEGFISMPTEALKVIIAGRALPGSTIPEHFFDRQQSDGPMTLKYERREYAYWREEPKEKPKPKEKWSRRLPLVGVLLQWQDLKDRHRRLKRLNDSVPMGSEGQEELRVLAATLGLTDEKDRD